MGEKLKYNFVSYFTKSDPSPHLRLDLYLAVRQHWQAPDRFDVAQPLFWFGLRLLTAELTRFAVLAYEQWTVCDLLCRRAFAGYKIARSGSATG